MKGGQRERVAIQVQNSVHMLEELGQKEPPPHYRSEAIDRRKSVQPPLVHQMQVEAGSRIAAHRLKLLASAARKALVVDDLELERRSTGMDQARHHHRGRGGQIVRVERETYDDAIAHSGFRARMAMVQLLAALPASVSRRSLSAMSICMTA